MVFRSDGTSEDCLYLNVWAPKKGKQLLPVLVYFYGGGFVAGDGSEPRYDGESMAQKGVVALTVNYRLGVFGFMAHPELTKESPHNASGNYGLLDQSAALRWVKQNIVAFGGDPSKVTIAGESAGSISVSAQMASPLSKELINGAIGESGSMLGALSAVPLAQGEQAGQQFCNSIGAHSLAELRALPADSVLSASTRFGAFRFSPTIDGWFFPQSPFDIYRSGAQAHVPLLVGWNNEENNFHSILGNDQPTKENYTKAVQRLYGDKAADILKVYDPATDGDVERVATDLASDRFIAFSTWKWADMQMKTGGKPVYRYLYERGRPGMYKGGTNASQVSEPSNGAVHSAEIEYALGNLAGNKVYAWTEDDYKVSHTMQEYFASFIKTGNPNSPGLPSWPAAKNGQPVQVMHINVNTKAEPEKNRERYVLMDSFIGKK
jgi:para-nitrobenzyl esterase